MLESIHKLVHWFDVMPDRQQSRQERVSSAVWSAPACFRTSWQAACQAFKVLFCCIDNVTGLNLDWTQ